MLALTGGTIYVTADADPLRDGVVLIDGQTIVSVGTEAPPEGANVLASGPARRRFLRQSSSGNYARRSCATASPPFSTSRPTSRTRAACRDAFERPERPGSRPLIARSCLRLAMILQRAEWWAHLVGVLRVQPRKIAPIILK
jgi:hypothetical protein